LKPVKNFEICVFNDGAIYLDQILKLSIKKRPDHYIKKNTKDKEK
jgi:hypothetical protein